jgi:hypothetical protein
MPRTTQSLPQGIRHWAPTPQVSPRSRQSATGPPDSHPDRTHTGKRDELTTKDHLNTVTSSLLVAQKTEVTSISCFVPALHNLPTNHIWDSRQLGDISRKRLDALSMRAASMP